MELHWPLALPVSAASGWDWIDFWTTTLATLVGAGISAFVGWLIFRGQRDDRYQERVTDAFVKLLDQIVLRITALEKYKTDMILAGQTERNRPSTTGQLVLPPDQWALLSSIQLATMVARGGDAVIVDAARARIGDTLHFGPDEEIAALGNISTGISQYRATLWPLEKSVERLRQGRQIDRSEYIVEKKPRKPKRRQWPRSL